MKKEMMTADMYTAEGEMLRGDKNIIPWQDHPRPSLQRNSYLCLNGDWDFSVSKKGETPDYSEKIRVPFVPQSLLSGIHREIPEDATLCYKRSFSIDGFDGKNRRTILHIGAADQRATVYVNGTLVGEHIGGYDRFSFDISDMLDAENTVEIRVTDDHLNQRLPYGKQSANRGGMWYTPISGIWQTVWIEQVPKTYVTKLTVSSDLEGADIRFETNTNEALDGKLILHLDDRDMEYEIKNGKIRLEPSSPRMWSPDDPYLYSFTARLGEDEISSYFALRTVEIKNERHYPKICLNGKPLFFHGLLDQGYYSDGIFLPATPDGYKNDIMKAKELGFNMLRKHIKVEPELFYYYCDKYGMIVFQDMVNNSDYSFFRDTALPTVGFKRRDDRKMHKDPESRRLFYECMEKTVAQLAFHPSVCYWTIFNEGWGQFDHAEAYRRLKQIDNSRPIDSVSGWFYAPRGKETVSDIESMHVYFKPIKLSPSDKPIVVSEFGGYSYKIEDHSFNKYKNYGYGSVSDSKALEDALTALYTDQVIPAIRLGLCGTVYTQISDVEDETNGLMTYDRRVTKVSAESMNEISKAIFKAFEETVL